MKSKISNLKKGILFTLVTLFSLAAFAQNVTVRGNVTDGSGESLVGATVQIKGTSIGTVTDVDGNFTLPNVSSSAILEVSYVGMRTQTISVNGRTIINVILEEDTE